MPYPRAWFYSRKSRALGDPEDPALLENHWKEMLKKAAEDGQPLSLADRIFEIGSGEYIEERPRFAALLRHWQSLPMGCGGIIYTPEVARLSRGSQSEWGRIEEALRRACIVIRTRRRTFDLNDPDDCNWLEWEILYTRFELRMNKIRMQAWRAGQLRAGKLRTGQVPRLGYWWDKNKEAPVVDPDTFPLLQRLCQEALTKSVHALAREYGLSQSSLLWTLRNPMICGWPAQRWTSYLPEKGWNRHGWRLPRDQWRWPETAGEYPAACTRAEWELLQAAIDARADGKNPKGADAGWCRDVVSFVGCAGRVSLSSFRPPFGRQYPTYQIRTVKPRPYVDREVVHAAAGAALGRVFLAPAALRHALARYLEHAGDEEQAETVDLARTRAAMQKERRRLVNLVKAENDPDASLETLAAAHTARRETERHLERLKRDLDQGAPPPVLTGLADLWDDLAPLAEDWTGLWGDPAMSVSRRRLLVRHFLQEIPVLIDPSRGRHPIMREVLPVRYQAWLADMMTA